MMRIIAVSLCLILTACAGGGGKRGAHSGGSARVETENMVSTIGYPYTGSTTYTRVVANGLTEETRPVPAAGTLPCLLIAGGGALAALRLRARRRTPRR